MEAYRYPIKRHSRRHGPGGYQSVESYRPWLRDEFTFRCVYCLEREQWSNVVASFDIEHFEPVVHAPRKSIAYNNLLYACHSCNALKGSQRVPNPLHVLLSDAVRVRTNGRIEGQTKEAAKLIDIMGLDDPAYQTRRRLIHRFIRLAKRHDAILYRSLLGFPDDLPDLSRLRPPRNSRKHSVMISYYEQRKSGKLAESY